MVNSCGCNTVSIPKVDISLTPVNTECNYCTENVGCIPTDAECVIYTGSTLANINTFNGDNLEQILVKINNVLNGGTIEPSYAAYNTACIASYGSTLTQQGFVETISEVVCDLISDFNSFTTVTYTNFVTSVNNSLNSLNFPNLNSVGCLTFLSTDTQKTVLQKIVNKIADLCNTTDVTSVNWNQCVAIVPTPVTIQGGFNAVIAEICNLKNIINNLATPTYLVKVDASDTNPGTLNDKIVTNSSCLTKSVVTIGASKRLQLGLAFSPKAYTFNPAQFNVLSMGTDGCTESFFVNLTNPTTGGDVTCAAISSLFTNTGLPVTTILGKDTDNNCATITPCELRRYMFGEFPQGDYKIRVNTSVGELCNQYTLVPDTGNNYTLPIATNGILGGVKIGSGITVSIDGTISTVATGGTVTSVGLDLPTSTFSVINSPIINSGTLTATFNPQAPNTVFIGPVTGLNATPTWRKLVTADFDNNIITLPKLQQLPAQTLLGNSSGSTANVETITIGANLTLTGGVLSATGGGGGGGVTSVGLTSSDITVGGASPITGAGTFTLTLPNINSNIGTFNSVTVNAKGQVTAASNVPTSNQPITFTASGDITGSSTGATSLSPSLTISNNVVTFAKIQDIPSQTIIGRYDAGTGDPQSLTIGSGLSLSSGGVLTASNAGTVTSIGLTTPNTTFMTVTNSPVTTSGNITVTLNSQAPNQIFVGPTTGANATPSFRTMVTADITNSIVTYPKIQNVIAKRLLGRYDTSNGIVQEITVGSGLLLSNAGILSAVGGSIDDTNFAINDLLFTGNRIHDVQTYNLTIRNADNITYQADKFITLDCGTTVFKRGGSETHVSSIKPGNFQQSFQGMSGSIEVLPEDTPSVTFQYTTGSAIINPLSTAKFGKIMVNSYTAGSGAHMRVQFATPFPQFAVALVQPTNQNAVAAFLRVECDTDHFRVFFNGSISGLSCEFSYIVNGY